ncbi:hypothetical protein K505DRAFT_351300 [Melanomma pulvis-pyrius CBS 109.77]|uniref:L-ornithine N(5)-monooxygenase [NAD(P)H] n=1 Tax=Melanomma pulvis-pyrius CBS 109.77 TaxID=1314802 RepID=A0A6A6X550_9PLEO|nr:hypothetical protein K505DRAFT_351300 [Melanomma pulvis-pyrius CBS 109.77]
MYQVSTQSVHMTIIACAFLYPGCLSGIAAAQRYLDIHPNAKIAILEKDADIGGVFSRRRIHDGFWTEWTIGLSEFSDLPMKSPPEQDCRHGFYKAEYTTQYLEEYVSRVDETGRTLRERMSFGLDVQSIKEVGGRWRILCTDSHGDTEAYVAEKLMVASGLTSLPDMPDLVGKEEFGGPIVHSGDFGEHGPDILASETVKKITVISGGKSSDDMVYAAVKAGKYVSWAIRTTGTGAPFFALGKGRGGYKNAFEAAHTRMVASMNLSIFNAKNWWTTFSHGTSAGIALLKRMMAAVDVGMRKEADYKGRKSEKGFEKMEYDAPSLSPNFITLEGDGTIQSDAILCGTGWKPSLQFFDSQLLIALGLPHLPSSEPAATTKKWTRLTQDADKHICGTYPMLANPPPHPHKPSTTTPYRLYQGMAPLHNRSILFLNHVSTGNKIFVADVQAMWAAAYFSDGITLPSLVEMEKSVALWTAFSRRRYLSAGELGNNIAFESVTYANRLLEELGVSGRGKGQRRDLFEPFSPRDLGRAWREYREKGGENMGLNFEYQIV